MRFEAELSLANGETTRQVVEEQSLEGVVVVLRAGSIGVAISGPLERPGELQFVLHRAGAQLATENRRIQAGTEVEVYFRLVGARVRVRLCET